MTTPKTQITLDKLYQEFLQFAHDNKKQLNKMEKKFDKLFNFLDKDVMKDKRRIDRIEERVFRTS